MIRFLKNLQFAKWKVFLGEIALIFIGITLAIWFNNWNQSRIDRNTARNYLSSLVSDLENDIQEYNNLLKANEVRIRRINDLNEILSNNDIEVNCDTVQKCIVSASFINLFIGSLITINDLENTGNLNLIEDLQLKRKLMNYYRDIESRKKYEELNSTFHVNTIGPWLKEKWNTGGLFRKGMNIKSLKSLQNVNDSAVTTRKVEEIRNNDQLKQELFNQINFSLFIIDGNNYSYRSMKREAEELVRMIGGE